jgi:hypothetical protein
MGSYILIGLLSTVLVSIITTVWVVGEIRSKKNPRVEFRIERYVVSPKYVFPSPSPVILVGYYNRLENAIVLSISSVVSMVWRKMLKEEITSSAILEQRFIDEFVKELDTVLIHELTEWAIHQLELKRILTHGLWNQYIRRVQ